MAHQGSSYVQKQRKSFSFYSAFSVEFLFVFLTDFTHFYVSLFGLSDITYIFLQILNACYKSRRKAMQKWPGSVFT